MIPAAAAALGDHQVLHRQPDALEQRDLGVGRALQSSAGEVGEVAGDPVPRPHAFLHGEVQVAGLRLRRGEVVDRDGGAGDQIGGDLAQVEAVRADEVDVGAGVHVGEAEQRSVGTSPGADDVARRGVGVRAGGCGLADCDQFLDDSGDVSVGTSGYDDAIDVGTHDAHRLDMSDRLRTGADDAE